MAGWWVCKDMYSFTRYHVLPENDIKTKLGPHDVIGAVALQSWRNEIETY